ncbi:hypothetical protein [Plantactinospora endophytica]|uniref:Uncharacterized protein n=1 Tax=Plantactinospora endophytica TaxID=673535 RepID=A0ABQ4DWX7_9ACTN|nr:hypothetical protein [Plantactinospora endophytica]GIG86947.1 hypothetical protein Pen02_18830 [Plantactinospora endophytica]
MTLKQEDTYVGYARASVNAKTLMAEHYARKDTDDWVSLILAGGLTVKMSNNHQWQIGTTTARVGGRTLTRQVELAWRHGEPFVVAPAMTAIVAAAAQALDLTDDLVAADTAPCDDGVLFLPQPIFVGSTSTAVRGIAAITWTTMTTPVGRSWMICGWADHGDTDDPYIAALLASAAYQRNRASFGPYILTDLTALPIGRPVPTLPLPDSDAEPIEWQSAADGRIVIDDRGASRVCAAIAYSFWRIQAQPLATVTEPTLPRSTSRRAVRASVAHNARVVMLRRTKSTGPRDDNDAKWHYQVRFFVRGHWRHLSAKDGTR